jgi:hypothetical protein
MKKLIALAAILLASSVVAGSPAAVAMAMEQRGAQSESRTLTGHVYNAQNEPQQKAIVYLKNTKTMLIKTYITETDGGYRFAGIAPNIDFEVYAEHEGLRSDTKTVSGFDSRKEVSITLKLHSK